MWRHGCIAIGVTLGLLGASSSGAVPAFPGAEGYGARRPADGPAR